jgi:aminopeptidase N
MVRLSLPLLRAGCWLAVLWLLLGLGAARAAVPHMALEVELDPASRRLQATARLTSDRVPDLVLHPRLAISRASVDGVAVAPAQLRRFAPGAGTHSFVIDYAGTLPALPAREPQSANPASFYAAPEGSYLAPEAG